MANLDTSQAISSKDPIAYTAVGGSGDRVLYNEGVFLVVRNGGATPTTVNITVPGNTRWGAANPASSDSVPAGEDVPIPLLSDFVDPSDGRVAVACSPTADVEIAVMRA